MGVLRDGMLQGLKFDPETKKWTTKTWELKKNPKMKTAAEEAKSPIIDGNGLELRLLPGGSMVWRIAYRFQKTRKSYMVGRYTGQEDGVSLSEAREVLIQVKKWIKDGLDPSEQKKSKKNPIPVQKSLLSKRSLVSGLSTRRLTWHPSTAGRFSQGLKIWDFKGFRG